MSQSRQNRSKDFYNELKRQYELLIEQEVGKKSSDQFPLVLDAYEQEKDDTIHADLLTPDTFGHPVNITWQIEGDGLNVENFDAAKGAIRFSYGGVPLDEIKRFLKPNKKLPFTIRKYNFEFECFHFHEFKDIALKFFFKADVEQPSATDIGLIIEAVIHQWNKQNESDINNTIDYVSKIQKMDSDDYKLSIDLGPSNKKVIGLILDELDNDPLSQTIKKIVLE